MSEVAIKTAIISVTDKSNLEALGSALKKRAVRILSSSGTMKFLSEQGFEVEDIGAYTGSPEILGGRVKTLHPKIHAGILADRSKEDHLQQLLDGGIDAVDLVVVNVYPFQAKYQGGGLSERELCEFIDIGGITLIRAAAKNFHSVAIVTNPADYERVAQQIDRKGTVDLETRRELARDAFALTASYDAAISHFFNSNAPGVATPDTITLSAYKVSDLRYGENPHQYAAVYKTLEDSPIGALEQHQGKELSYNNYLDLIAAFSLARDLGPNAVSIIKHTNPCGAAWCADPLTSFRRALQTDRVSAFGGIVAVNGIVDEALSDELHQLFLEVVVARGFADGVLELFAKKKNLRVITIDDRYWNDENRGAFGLLSDGMFLMQNSDSGFPELEKMQVQTKKAPSDAQLRACRMAWKVCKHVKSNAIVIADEEGTVGIGAGQMSRVDSSQIATRKAFDANFSLSGKVAASDAFFPFADGVTTLAKTGIEVIVQPGGSIRDQEVIDAADSANIAMLFTGRRHFRHV